MNWNKIAGYIKGIILTVAVIALALQVVDYGKGFYREYMEEYEGTSSHKGQDVEVVIEKGMSAKQIANVLKDAGLIKYPSAFTRRLKNSPYKGKLQSGTYTLNTGMNTLQMMEALSPVPDVDEPVDKLVIPEGYTIEMIAERCASQNICTKQEFLNAVNSITPTQFEYLNDVPAGADVKYKLQGYIFPATYDIYESTTAESLVKWMLRTFDDYYSGERAARAAEMGYTSYEIVTMASIVEREAKVEEERATIAGVIKNRLDAGMLLQMCPTVLYPLTNGMYDQAQVYYSDLELDSPYNTYKYEGLPVGPICNPGLACLDAVLYPEAHDYYYYHVSDEDAGTHVFTETYEEHRNPQIIDDSEDSEE